MKSKSLGDKIKQGRQIVEAVSTPLPESEKWFMDRLSICDGCEWNSKNSPYNLEEMTLMERVAKTAKDKVCRKKEYCKACGCCIELKASLKESVCGLVELNEPQEPKWFSIETKSPLDKDITIINLSPESGKTSTELSNIVYDFGVTDKDKLSAHFQIKRKGGFNFKTFNVGCSCTVANPKVIDKNTVEFNIDISTLNFRKGLTKRSMSITYFVSTNKTKTINITFKMTMDGK